MYAIISELLQSTASVWGFALGSVIAFCTMAARMVTTRYKTKAGIIDAETAQLIARNEQARLNHSCAVEVEFLTQLTRRMKVEADNQRPAMPAVQPSPAQVEKKAA
ncbi:MAG: hypothetical protein ACJ8EB_13095 [Allosphingosinicella sp.]